MNENAESKQQTPQGVGSTDLLVCPFCGSEAVKILHSSIGWRYKGVGCTNDDCIASYPIKTFDTWEKAIGAWNTRVGSTDLFAAADPFRRVLAVIDALPPSFLPSNDKPLYEVLPRVWPTLGELRAFVDAANDRTERSAGNAGRSQPKESNGL